MNKNTQLLTDVHSSLIENAVSEFSIKSPFKYCHYNCDGFNDVGWGCGYRTLQSICSQIITAKALNRALPTIPEIQKTLVDIGDKNPSFLGSRDWIGTLEAAYVLDTLFDVPCRMVHINRGQSFGEHKDALVQYFTEFGGLVMMGGDVDASSKGIAGIRSNADGSIDLLVVDPHFAGTAQSAEDLVAQGFVKWQSQNDFVDSSFYNLCLPKIKL